MHFAGDMCAFCRRYVCVLYQIGVHFVGDRCVHFVGDRCVHFARDVCVISLNQVAM